ncbi:MAG: hypothetical protein HQL59_08520 [Magnetococcales bacterium]|nr:hypothetical protein [Magnetococcales bacterium]
MKISSARLFLITAALAVVSNLFQIIFMGYFSFDYGLQGADAVPYVNSLYHGVHGDFYGREILSPKDVDWEKSLRKPDGTRDQDWMFRRSPTLLGHQEYIQPFFLVPLYFLMASVFDNFHVTGLNILYALLTIIPPLVFLGLMCRDRDGGIDPEFVPGAYLGVAALFLFNPFNNIPDGFFINKGFGELLAFPLSLAFLYLLAGRRVNGVVVVALLVVLVKENIALFPFLMSFYIFFHISKRVGLLVAAVSVLTVVWNLFLFPEIMGAFSTTVEFARRLYWPEQGGAQSVHPVGWIQDIRPFLDWRIVAAVVLSIFVVTMICFGKAFSILTRFVQFWVYVVFMIGNIAYTVWFAIGTYPSYLGLTPHLMMYYKVAVVCIAFFYASTLVYMGVAGESWRNHFGVSLLAVFAVYTQLYFVRWGVNAGFHAPVSLAVFLSILVIYRDVLQGLHKRRMAFRMLSVLVLLACTPPTLLSMVSLVRHSSLASYEYVQEMVAVQRSMEGDKRVVVAVPASKTGLLSFRQGVGGLESMALADYVVLTRPESDLVRTTPLFGLLPEELHGRAAEVVPKAEVAELLARQVRSLRQSREWSLHLETANFLVFRSRS